ncbi:MAG: L,D-transpeptidase family protein [Acetobacteraceae bacterium]
MRAVPVALLALGLGYAGCAADPAPAPQSQATRSPSPSTVAVTSTVDAVSVPFAPLPPALPPDAAAAEAVRLRAALAREVHGLLRQTPSEEHRFIGLAQAMLASHHVVIDRAQILVVVDRDPHVQQLALVLAQPDAPWEVLGGTHVSTGQPNRHGYYITPTGVFTHDSSILDYRALGTYNENHIRGLGVKGMRVWDFGWQSASKGWLHTGETGDMRLLMHATDPTYLAQRIGRPASEGCVRIPADMNHFLDRHGLLDADYERTATYDVAYRAILPANRAPTPLAGDKLVIVDSSGG